ncbi:hypothetical protein AB8O64_04585 [Streptomyces sp. QH1-20]
MPERGFAPEAVGTWPRNFLRAYRDGLLDYFLITAARPAPVRRPV